MYLSRDFLAIEDVAVFEKVFIEMFICFILFLFTPFLGQKRFKC